MKESKKEKKQRKIFLITILIFLLIDLFMMIFVLFKLKMYFSYSRDDIYYLSTKIDSVNYNNNVMDVVSSKLPLYVEKRSSWKVLSFNSNYDSNNFKFKILLDGSLDQYYDNSYSLFLDDLYHAIKLIDGNAFTSENKKVELVIDTFIYFNVDNIDYVARLSSDNQKRQVLLEIDSKNK